MYQQIRYAQILQKYNTQQSKENQIQMAKKTKTQSQKASPQTHDPLNGNPSKEYPGSFKKYAATIPNNVGTWNFFQCCQFYEYYTICDLERPYWIIADAIQSRDYEQVRSHAQKVTNKLQKIVKEEQATRLAKMEIQLTGNSRQTRNKNHGQHKLPITARAAATQQVAQRREKADSEYTEDIKDKMREELKTMRLCLTPQQIQHIQTKIQQINQKKMSQYMKCVEDDQWPFPARIVSCYIIRNCMTQQTCKSGVMMVKGTNFKQEISHGSDNQTGENGENGDNIIIIPDPNNSMSFMKKQGTVIKKIKKEKTIILC